MIHIEFQMKKLQNMTPEAQSSYWQRYEDRVFALELKGFARSDAQAVVDCEEYKP